MAEPIRTRGGSVGFSREIDDLTSIAPRRAGSEGERRAARHLQQRLQTMGRDAELEPTRIRPGWPLAHLIHAVAGVVGSVVSVYSAPLGLVIAAVATISAFGDLTGSFSLVRTLLRVRASQNVVSDEDEGKPGVVVLVAHYDAPINSSLTSRRLAIWPRAMFASLAVITLCTIFRLIGLQGTIFTVVQFIPTVVLIVLTPLFADAAISNVSDSAADNAAGVAVVLRLAAKYSRHLEHFDLVVVFTGASAHFGLGFRPWLKRHRGELNPTAAAVISVDNLANGAPAYAAKEGAVFASRMHPTLVDLASEAGEDVAVAAPREMTDAYVSRASGLPTLRITTEDADPDEPVDDQALERVYEFTCALLERIDAEIGPMLD